MLEFISKKEADKMAIEEQKKNMVRHLHEANINQSASEKKQAEEQIREFKRLEQEKFRDNILQMQEGERQKNLQDRMNKQNTQSQYLNELN